MKSLCVEVLSLLIIPFFLSPVSAVSAEPRVSGSQDDGGDLTIGYIQRLPEIDYVWGSTDPAVEGWPAVGQPVVWRAHIKNWSGSPRDQVAYRWILDGEEAASGTVNMAASAEDSVDFEWNWTFDRHRLQFIIDPDDLVDEEEEENNSLTIFTDAITVGYYVEQSVYDYFKTYQHMLGVGSNCWEDWAQRLMTRWNGMLENAVHPETPEGVLDRVRLDKITVVPDGALPLVPIDDIEQEGASAVTHPNRSDRTVDMQWGFTKDAYLNGFFSDHRTVSDNNPFYFAGVMLHELGHARYLVDVYGFSVYHGVAGGLVEIEENGEPVAGTDFMPGTRVIYNGTEGLILYMTGEQGLMNTKWTYMDRYSAVCMNLIAGHRATRGNYNEPENIGVFLNDLPAENRLTVRDAGGALLTNARIRIYQAVGQENFWYAKKFDNIPDLQGTTDGQGQVVLGRNPFSGDSDIRHTWEESNAVIIVRVEQDGKAGYAFLDVAEFNLEYWRGHTELGEYEICVDLNTVSGVAGDDFCMPLKFRLNPNHPNPFNGSTRLEYELPERADVRLKIHDLLGREVRTLVRARQNAGGHAVVWDGKDEAGREAGSGIYVAELKAGNHVGTRKMLLVR